MICFFFVFDDFFEVCVCVDVEFVCIFYGCCIIGVLFVIFFILVGFGFYLFGLFFKVIVSEFGGFCLGVGGVLIIFMVVMVLMGLWFGCVVDGGLICKIMIFGVFCFVLGFFFILFV